MQFRGFTRAALTAVGLLAVACAGDRDADNASASAQDVVTLLTVTPEARDAALAKVQERTGGNALVSMHDATRSARFIRVKPGSLASLSSKVAKSAAEKANQSAAFFRELGAAVGVPSADMMKLVSTSTDRLGKTHLTYKQVYGGVPVFGATVKTHFDASGKLEAVAGTAIGDIAVSTTPRLTRDQAGAAARAAVVVERGESEYIRAGAGALTIFREGLAMGVPGNNYLAWEIEITDGQDVRDMVYVDADSGKIIDRISGVHDALFRRAWDGHGLPRIPDNWPQGVYWSEGQRFPTVSDEANNMIISSKEVYDFFKGSFGMDSIDGKGARMDEIFNRGYGCPNASWNGTFISFCPGLTTDDVTAHEWAHAYTDYTHNLIYQWQPGALNEAYSDIWGETVDRINGRGGDSPSAVRTAGECSTFSPPVPRLVVNAPAAIGGVYIAASASFGKPFTTTGITADVVAALDGNTGTAADLDACTAILNKDQVAGKIAIVNRGTCEFGTKALNAQNAGAIAVIVANNTTGLIQMGPGVDGAKVTISALSVEQTTGQSIRAQLSAAVTVNATALAREGKDASYRWLMGEDAVGGITGALRDMWNPNCYSNPAKVSDVAYYWCASSDQGGVHINSGIPNHAYALLVDGGSYNGQTVRALGLTKAAQIYFRAQDVWQVEDSNFKNHADALEASCSELLGQTFTTLPSDTLNGPINADDCAQVTKAIAAVEMRATPSCAFAPLLDPRTAANCSTATTETGSFQPIASYDFEGGESGFTVSHDTSSSTFDDRDWTLTAATPAKPANFLAGANGFFANAPNNTTCEGDDQTGVLHLTSPVIPIPSTAVFARATFDHWMSSEAFFDGAGNRVGVDGGNLKVSVNGGGWQLVPASQLSFNSYSVPALVASPLAGQPAFAGTNQGSLTAGSWGRTHVDLGNMAAPGDAVQLRWDFGSDCGVARLGWYVDNVNVFSCTPKVPALSIADVKVAEGTGAMTFTLLLSTPTIKAIAVTLATQDDLAVHGNDYDRLEQTVIIPASSATVGVGGIAVTIPLKDDTVSEGDETFRLRVLNVTNATLGANLADGEAIGTIADDDAVQTAVNP